jgi:hypothetical protein
MESQSPEHQPPPPTPQSNAITICNNTRSAVDVAVVEEISQRSTYGFNNYKLSRGWFNVRPSGCREIGQLEGKISRISAESVNGQVWGGSGGRFCIHPSGRFAYNSRNVNSIHFPDSQSCRSNSGVLRDFFALGNGQRTVTLNP